MDQPDITDFRYKILAHIYYFTEKGTKPLIVHKLANLIGLPQDQVATAVRYLDKHLLVNLHPDGSAVWMTPRGMAEVEKPSAPHFAVTHNTTNINAPNLGNVMTGGSGNTQTISINPNFDKAINNLLQLVQSSSLEPNDKEELTDEIIKVNHLASKEPSPRLLEKLQSRLGIIKAGITASGLLMKATPFLETVWHYIKVKYNL